MSESNGVLELKLAHEEKARPDGGTLRIDSNKQVILWEGIPGEFGCKLRVEASFDDVKEISVSELAGFVLELRSGKNRKLALIPAPHAWWFVQQWATRDGNVTKTIPEGALRDHNGDGMAVTGSAGGAGPTVKHRDIPKPVVADTLTAANAIRAALGRPSLR
ncbi:MAG: hypothetical protein ABI565_01860 [Vicinamibacteria bacterium]